MRRQPRSENLAYIKQDSSKEEIYEAYLVVQKELKRVRHNLTKHKEDRAKLRKHKNEVYNKLKYKLYKANRKIYIKDKHIFRLQCFINRAKAQAKKEGFEKGKGKVRVREYSIIKMYEFLLQVDNVTNILELPLSHCAFILWAGRYTFFTHNDYKTDNPTSNHGFHKLLNYFRKRNFIIEVGHQSSLKQFSLTATGLDLFNKIDKFTKRQFNISDNG